MWESEKPISDLLGKIINKIDILEDEISFTLENGDQYRMLHHQDCCESVYVEDIIGDVEDLIGSPITEAEEVNNNENPRYEYDQSFTWTFYKLGTIKGHVTIRWYGSSNGYYSERVAFCQHYKYRSINSPLS